MAHAVGRSRELVTQWERGPTLPNLIDLARWGAVVGLDVPVRAHLGGSPLRDGAQLRILASAREGIGPAWSWSTEVAVSDLPLDRRALDAVIRRGKVRIGLEVISRLTDAQAQVRAATLKLATARLDAMVLVLADTRHNRRALATPWRAAPTRSRHTQGRHGF